MRHETDFPEDHLSASCGDQELEHLKASFDNFHGRLSELGMTLPTFEEIQRLLSLLHASRTKRSATSDRPMPCALSERQYECMYWIARGKSSWEIAQIMKISESTVSYHIKQVLHYFNTNSRTVAAIRCVTAGYFTID